MLKKIVLGLFVATFLLAWIGGCTYDNLAELHPPDPTCDTTAVSFVNDIVPIMSGSCSSESAACHGTGNFNNALLNEYTGVKIVADNGKLVSSITWDGVATPSRMPSGSSSKIDDCSISKIERWVADGAPDN